MSKAVRIRIAIAAFVLALAWGTGFQVSGVTNIPFAIVCFASGSIALAYISFECHRELRINRKEIPPDDQIAIRPEIISSAIVLMICAGSFWWFLHLTSVAVMTEQPSQNASAPLGIEFSVADRLTFEHDGRHRIVVLILKNKLTRELVGLSVVLIKADGPAGTERITVPSDVKIPDHINPLGYSEIALADYQEEPSSDRVCLVITPYSSVFSCRWWSAKTSVEYTLFASAPESAPATITVRIWVDNGMLHYQQI